MRDTVSDETDRTTPASAQVRLFGAAIDPDLPREVRDAAGNWAQAFEGLMVEIKRGDKLLGWPEGQHGLDQSGLDGVAAAGLARYQREPGIDMAGQVVRALQDATIDTFARGRTLAIVLDCLERRGAKPNAP
jgi:hypothetical protein